MIPICNNVPDFGLCPSTQALLYGQEGPKDYALKCEGLCCDACNYSGVVECGFSLVPFFSDAT